MTTSESTPAERAIDYARTLGTEHGTNAAEWYLQDVLRSTRSAVEIKRITDGINDGDPEIMDSLPTADLSGQWADTLTGPALVEQAAWESLGDDADADDLAEFAGNAFTDVCDAYEYAYSDAVTAEIERACRYQTSDDDALTLDQTGKTAETADADYDRERGCAVCGEAANTVPLSMAGTMHRYGPLASHDYTPRV